MLTERQNFILALVIREHVDSTQPIGSKRLVETYNLDYSSATVRNEMAALTDAGYNEASGFKWQFQAIVISSAN